MRKLVSHKLAQMGMVGAAVGLLITLLITVLIFYNIAGSVDTASIDRRMGWNGSALDLYRPAGNATRSTMSQAATFFTIAPIIAIVIVAVVVIGYVQRIGQ